MIIWSCALMTTVIYRPRFASHRPFSFWHRQSQNESAILKPASGRLSGRLAQRLHRPHPSHSKAGWYLAESVYFVVSQRADGSTEVSGQSNPRRRNPSFRTAKPIGRPNVRGPSGKHLLVIDQKEAMVLGEKPVRALVSAQDTGENLAL